MISSGLYPEEGGHRDCELEEDEIIDLVKSLAPPHSLYSSHTLRLDTHLGWTAGHFWEVEKTHLGWTLT